MVIQNISESLNAALEPSADGGTKTIPPRDLTTTAEFVETIAECVKGFKCIAVAASLWVCVNVGIT